MIDNEHERGVLPVEDAAAALRTIPTILITGAAGFIGFHMARRLLKDGYAVIGIDNLNDYYDVRLKRARLRVLSDYAGFTFVEGDLQDMTLVDQTFKINKPQYVVHLAAQAGVRYSITNPRAYVDSNIVGFFNVLEACRRHPVKHLVYASSSSVYGLQEKVPFSIDDDVSKPISFYAATKKSNELMAYAYSHLYQIPATGLRFFTVYGPWGRPDMAYFSFTEKMRQGEPIQIFNYGDMRRDFTYIDDVVHGVISVMLKPPVGEEKHTLYNIGNNKPENLLTFIEQLETCLLAESIIDEPATKEMLPMQAGDVYQTYADVDALIHDVGFKPETSIEFGLKAFAKWYRQYYIDRAFEPKEDL
ncbi:MAG TPA: SDR family NAD(P)-dependent oxidoreductase [Clostridiaceae bacterium]|nr:SDR family NAD(P)-dependent oxidoreductase [Clostridiaceae bacterium]